MSRYCKVCEIEIDPRRIAILPDTQTCTQHSTAEKKVAMVVQMGEGDHTWTETYAVDREVYDKIQEVEKNWKKQTKPVLPPKAKPADEDDKIPTVDDFDINEEETSFLFEDEINDEYVDDEAEYSADELTEEE
jgi:hypothetical protein